MGTRSGSVDPFIVDYLGKKRGMNVDETLYYLNKKCGFVGYCGYSDCRDIYRLIAEGDEKARLAMDVFGYQIRKIIGAYAAAMNGLDAIIFTGGIGENSADARNDVCKDMEFCRNTQGFGGRKMNFWIKRAASRHEKQINCLFL